MLEAVSIRTPSGREVANLLSAGYWDPTWATTKAKHYIVYYDLYLPAGARTRDRYFTERCVTSDDGRYVAIQACHAPAGPEDIDAHNMELFVLDLNTETELRASGAEFGHVIPLGFEKNAVVYQKSQVNAEFGTEYEVSLDTRNPWQPIRNLHHP